MWATTVSIGPLSVTSSWPSFVIVTTLRPLGPAAVRESCQGVRFQDLDRIGVRLTVAVNSSSRG